MAIGSPSPAHAVWSLNVGSLRRRWTAICRDDITELSFRFPIRAILMKGSADRAAEDSRSALVADSAQLRASVDERNPVSLEGPGGRVRPPGCLRSPGIDVSPKRIGGRAWPTPSPPRSPFRPFDGQSRPILNECVGYAVCSFDSRLSASQIWKHGT